MVFLMEYLWQSDLSCEGIIILEIARTRKVLQCFWFCIPLSNSTVFCISSPQILKSPFPILGRFLLGGLVWDIRHYIWVKIQLRCYVGYTYNKYFQVLNAVMLKSLEHTLVSYMLCSIFSKSGISIHCIILTA